MQPGLWMFLQSALTPLTLKARRQLRRSCCCLPWLLLTLLLLRFQNRCLVGPKSWPTNKHDTKTHPHVALERCFLHARRTHLAQETEHTHFFFFKIPWELTRKLESINTCLMLAKLFLPCSVPLLVLCYGKPNTITLGPNSTVRMSLQNSVASQSAEIWWGPFTDSLHAFLALPCSSPWIRLCLCKQLAFQNI